MESWRIFKTDAQPALPQTLLNRALRQTRKTAMTNKLLAEFLGTLFFCAVALLAGNGLPAAMALAALVYALGYLSGGHFNPAVSIAVWMRGQLDKSEMFRYLGAQVAGAVGAFILFKILSGDSIILKQDVPGFRIFVGELCFTFLTAFTFLHVRTARQQLGNAYFGAAIGLSHLAGVSALSRLGMGACNPSLGLAFVLAGYVPAWMILVYLITGVLGGALATVLYRILNPND